MKRQETWDSSLHVCISSLIDPRKTRQRHFLQRPGRKGCAIKKRKKRGKGKGKSERHRGGGGEKKKARREKRERVVVRKAKHSRSSSLKKTRETFAIAKGGGSGETWGGSKLASCDALGGEANSS